MNQLLLLLGSDLEFSLVSKATLLLMGGLTIWRLARKTEASMRHLILGLTFGGLLLLPVFALLSPPVGLPVEQQEARIGLPTERAGWVSPRAVVGTGESQPPNPWRMPELQNFWMAGVALLLGLLGIDLLKLNRLKREGIPAANLSFRFRDVLVSEGRLPVGLLMHEQVSAPITWGTSRPVILLPTDAVNWDDGELRRMLIHEMEHVRRADWAVLLLARVVCTVYWFHPLVWMARRKLLLEAECACDDAVVRREECIAYAEQLVRLARRITNGTAEAALGMARRSDLGTRVSAILDGSRVRSRASIRSLVVAGMIALLTVGILAPLRAVAQKTGTGRTADVATIDQDLFESARDGNVTAVRAMLDAGANPNLSLPGDGSPLIAAALRGRMEVVKTLVAKGADVNLAVRRDGSPLIAAASRGRVEVVQFLLDQGARIDQEVPGDENALIGASARGHLAVVEMLVSRGANVNARIWEEGTGPDRTGEWRSPLNMAQRGRHDAVVVFLKNAGAQQ